MSRQRGLWLWLVLSFIVLFLLGTVQVLTTITYILKIDSQAYLTTVDSHSPSSHERVPRIIHQTWKTVEIPPRWKVHSDACRALMPDYKYMLWTDASSRDFIADYYPWFLDTFDGYKYPIQRADAIRYFVLYHYGGIYLDLDVGCERRLDTLLHYPVLLPETIPVGVSNDVLFAEKHHPFFRHAIYKLAAFDNTWILNYPTVMFSTGPMFLSSMYALYPRSERAAIRILAKVLYGKNIRTEDAPNAFFTHYYGSSWHSNDADFFGFLGKRGRGLIWLGLIIIVAGAVKLFLDKDRRLRQMMTFNKVVKSERRNILSLSRLPGWHHATHSRWPSEESDETVTSLDSPSSDSSASLLPLSFDKRSRSPSSWSEASTPTSDEPTIAASIPDHALSGSSITSPCLHNRRRPVLRNSSTSPPTNHRNDPLGSNTRCQRSTIRSL